MLHSSKLSHASGYLSLDEYLNDIEAMRKNDSWKIPFGVGDRTQVFFLKAIARLSWFADILHIRHANSIGPAYSILFSYLQKKQLVDSFRKRDLHIRGYFSYSLEKILFLNNKHWSIQGHGVAKDADMAFSKALGEIIERLISGVYDGNKEVSFISPNDLLRKSSVFYPPKYHRFLDIQKKKFKELNNNPAHPIDWVKGKNLITKKNTFIPKMITSWFIESLKGENILIEATTSGSAGYFTKTGAVLRGLLETIERDAFLVHWLTHIAPPAIQRDTLPKNIRAELREFQSHGISLYILNTTSIAIPSICVIAVNALSEVPQIILSTATALTFEKAIQDGLREMAIASEMFYYKNNSKQSGEAAKPEPFISSLDKISRQLYWRGTERIKQFQWFLSGTPVSYDEICKQDISAEDNDSFRLRACLDVLKKRGSDYYPIVYFPKHPIQEELGFYVAQVYIPKAFPLYLLEYQGTFDSDRLEEFAQSKGVSDWELNPLPHMFQ